MPRKNNIQIRKGTSPEWNSANSVLASGEPGFETDTLRLKIGNGTTAWSGLNYSNIVGSGSSNYLPRFTGLNLFTNSLIFDNGTNVGIGTAAPSALFSVHGGITNNYTAVALSTDGVSTTTHVGVGNSDARPFLASLNGNLSTSIYGWGFFDRGTDGFLNIQRKGGGTSWVSVMTMDRTNGNVGIGTGVQATTPPEKLTVDGNIRVADTTATQGNVIQFLRGGGGQYDYSIGKYGSALAISLANDSTSQRPLQVGYHSGVTFLPRFHVNGFTGAVGINTTTPSGYLDVAGDVFVRGTAGTAGRINFKSSTFADTLLNIRSDTGGNIYMDGGGAAIKCGSQDGQIDIRGFSTNVQIGHTYNAGTIAQHVRFTPGGSELMRMTNSGTMGIGLPLTSNLFNQQPYVNTRVHIAGSGSNSSSAALIVTDSGISPLFYVRNDGNVGIGTSSPSGKLHVVGTGLFTSIDINNSVITGQGALTVNGGIVTQGSFVRSSIFGIYGDNNTKIYKADNSTLNYSVSSSGYKHSLGYDVTGNHTSWMVVNNTGVGIGTQTPTSKLHVAGDILATGSFIGGSGTAALPSFEFVNDTDTGLFSPSANTIGLTTGGVERLRVDSSGNVGIGTTTPAYKLEVNGGFAASTKSFRINHPSKKDHSLEYGSLESPYHGVRLTGRGKVIKGVGAVSLPVYLKDLIHDDDTLNIQITNIKHGKTIYIDKIDLKNDRFIVKADRAKSLGELQFFWTLSGVRKDVDHLVVEKRN